MSSETTAQVLRFAAIGLVSMLLFLLLYSLFREVLGPQGSNLCALVITAVASTAANRRLTFGVRGRRNLGRSQIEGLLVFMVGFGVSSGSLALLAHTDPGAGHVLELAVLVIANGLATVLRFLAYRSWIFHPRRQRT